MPRAANVTQDHDLIRRWVEKWGGRPARVRGTGAGGDPGVIRIDFPGGAGAEALEPISWEEWFRKFDEKHLAFLYREVKTDRPGEAVRQARRARDVRAARRGLTHPPAASPRGLAPHHRAGPNFPPMPVTRPVPPRRARAALLALLLAGPAAPTAACGGRPAERPAPARAEQPPPYYPGPDDDWERRTPAEVGMDAAALDQAVSYARAHETTWPTSLLAALEQRNAREPFGEILGPVKDRGGPNGIILRHGYIVAEWGDTRRVDMTFSITKSYLAALAGLALDRGLIRSVHDPVKPYSDDGGFDSPHNARITWHMLLNQTSEWEGTLWGKPDAADRRAGYDRSLREPGTFWEYNDVRVNRLALSLLRVFKQPLPEVLRAEMMRPIGASDRWEWWGYRNSFVVLGGRSVQSVSGGGHWGGGLWISTRDHARFGLLHLRQGRWRDRQILSREWVRMATSPTPIKPTYGYLWWLNTGRELYPAAPPTSVFALGAGTNVIWLDPEHDLVAVVRWIKDDAVNGFIARVLAAIRRAPAAGASGLELR